MRGISVRHSQARREEVRRLSRVKWQYEGETMVKAMEIGRSDDKTWSVRRCRRI